MGYKSIIKTMPKPRPFIIEVKTDNAGSSLSNQFTIPTTGSGYSYTVKTTSGVTTGNTGNVTITWPTAGTYEIEIYGSFPRIFFNFLGDRLKILKVKQWGTIRWTNMSAAFRGCQNMDILASDVPDLSSVSDMTQIFQNCASLLNINNSISNWNMSAVTTIQAMFLNCTAFNVPLDSWNTSNILLMSSAFMGAASFNQDIGNWDVSNVVSFNNMFFVAGQYNNGGIDSIKNWTIKTSSTVNMSAMFRNASQFNQPIGDWNTSAVTNISSMFENATVFNQPIGGWDTSAVTNMKSMFLGASSFNQPIDTSGPYWNVSNVTQMDGMFNGATSFNQDIGGWNVSNVLNWSNTFRLSGFNNGGSSSIGGWSINTIGSVIFSAMFQQCSFNQPIGSWNTSAVTNMFAMFNATTSFNQDIGAWNVSNVANLQAVFLGASSFNNGGSSSIDGWSIKTSGPVNMTAMFQNATSFDQPIGSWNTSAVTTIQSIFSGATQFNQPLNTSGSSWNVSAVTNMAQTFNGASLFNQNLELWDTSSVTSMFGMFQNTSFNGDITTWNTSSVTDMTSMFQAASSFNQDIGSWNVSLVNDFSRMFAGATLFNNGGSTFMDNWVIKTSGPVTMLQMFSASGFNQPIGLWNTSEVTSTFQMFQSSPFNQDISPWNISKVTDMRFMFSSSSAFNQNLAIWSLRLTGVLLNNIFSNSVISTANYTDTIVGWANYVQNNSNTPASVSMANQVSRTFQNSRSGGAGFATAGAARTFLTSPTPAGCNWSITVDTVIA